MVHPNRLDKNPSCQRCTLKQKIKKDFIENLSTLVLKLPAHNMFGVILFAEYAVCWQSALEIIGTATSCKVVETSPPSDVVPHPFKNVMLYIHILLQYPSENSPVTIP